jgi:hypothetical protein
MSRNWKWTEHQVDKLNNVLSILEELHEYTPLTLRQIYYQLVGKGIISNNASQYTMISKLIKWARIDGRIRWCDIEDRQRVFHDLRGWYDKQEFIKHQIDIFLEGYRRDLLQSQEKYIEIWIEKDALSSIFTRIASPYTIPVVVCRGFSSISFLNNFKERLAYYRDKQALMLYFGDFDPSGVEMFTSMQTTLNNELAISDIEFKREALLKDDISTYQLPHNPDALKRTDSRAKKHLKAYGELAVELDALRPDILQGKVKEAIELEIDIDAYNYEIKKYVDEVGGLVKLKERVNDIITS